MPTKSYKQWKRGLIVRRRLYPARIMTSDRLAFYKESAKRNKDPSILENALKIVAEDDRRIAAWKKDPWKRSPFHGRPNRVYYV